MVVVCRRVVCEGQLFLMKKAISVKTGCQWLKALTYKARYVWLDSQICMGWLHACKFRVTKLRKL